MLCRRRMFMVLMIFPSLFSRKLHSQSVSSSRSLVDTLNTEAQANDQDGVHAYCAHLVWLLVGNEVPKGNTESLTDRLAVAERAARRGERPLISESEIATAFNSLMSQIRAPDELRTDAAMVHGFRVGPLSRSEAPYLITLNRNGANCNPGEAVFLLYLLIANNATIEGHVPPGTTSVMVPSLIITTQAPSAPNARRSIHDYAKLHHGSKVIEAFNHVAQILRL